VTWELAVDAERAAALSACVNFQSIVERITREMQILCRHIQSCDDAAGFKRAIYCICVPRATFDAFFNSERGYRGAYFQSPYEGLAANDELIGTLQPKLIEWAAGKGIADLHFDVESLGTHSAKVWLAEAGVNLCGKCDGEWTHPQDDVAEILNGRWEMASDIRGRKAPILAKIKIFGAFLNERNDEFISWRKRHRAWEIHESGWA